MMMFTCHLYDQFFSYSHNLNQLDIKSLWLSKERSAALSSSYIIIPSADETGGLLSMQLKFFSLLMDGPIKKSHTLVYCNPVSHTDYWAESRTNEVCAASVYIPHRYMIGIWHVASTHTHTQM